MTDNIFYARRLKPRFPPGGMIVFPAGIAAGRVRAAVTSVLSRRHTEEWQFGHDFVGRVCMDGVKFNHQSLTVEITGVYRNMLEETAFVLTRKCALAKILVKDFYSGRAFFVNRAKAAEETYDAAFVDGFYRALEEEKLIHGDEFRAFLKPNVQFRFPGEMFYNIRQAKKRFLRYFFLTIDKYPYNTDL